MWKVIPTVAREINQNWCGLIGINSIVGMWEDQSQPPLINSLVVAR